MVGDRYRIVGLLGRGGMGEVYRADDLDLGQPVALKFLPAEVERDPDRLSRFVAEVRTARQIAHPNVCRVYDIGEIDGRRFLSMEYVDGEDLRTLLRRIGHLPEDKGLQIARQICAGLGAMHDRDILHRDLKPSNVMLDGRGRVRLTDFGLATAVTGAGGDGEVAGTPAYMAPEQLAGGPLSVQSDVYALGLLLFELFTGERVHKSDKPADLLAAHRRPPTPALSTSSGSHLDPAVQRVLERCLERDPTRRPASAVAVAAALPGGDPLGAALAAGETPSPQMVAAAGDAGGLSLKVAVPCLVALVVAVGLFAWANGRRQITSVVPFPHSPDVLATKAREMLGRLGYTEPVADSAYGFTRYGGYSAWISERDTSRDRWRHLASVKPSVIAFWYRTSPRPMVPVIYFGRTPGGSMAVTTRDPPLTRAGMTLLELSPDGHLVALRVVLPEKESPSSASQPNWSRLFDEAGLDVAAFKPVAPEWLAQTDADARAAWAGPGADDAGAELRIEAAAFGGKPVFFRLIAPWTAPADTPRAGSTNDWVGYTEMAMGFAILGTALVLGFRNARLGRADRRGAGRLALATGLIVFTGGSIGSHFVGSVVSPGDLETIFTLLSWACLSAALAWTCYTAIEPHVRRRWPQMLIAWTRLLDGQWRDPLIGRHLLLGSLIGLGLALLTNLHRFVSGWRGEPPILPFTSMNGWTGIPSAVAVILDHVQGSALSALFLVVLLVLLRILLRGERAAAIGFVVLFGGGSLIGSSDPLVDLAFVAVVATILLVATRLGLVALVAAMLFVRGGGSLSVMYPFPSFLTGTVVLGVIAVLVPGVFGFFTSTAGRKATVRWLDE